MRNFSDKGILTCARYAGPPNVFGYCGPEEQVSLHQHIHEHVSDKELQYILSRFETVVPYLTYIAHENKIDDLFHEKVVEAYWIGNDLLHPLSAKETLSFLKDLLRIEKKVPDQKIKQTSSIYPHHTFHVCAIFSLYCQGISHEKVNTMNECRISTGVIQSVNKRSAMCLIATDKLVLTREGRLTATSHIRSVSGHFLNKTEQNRIKKGMMVSVHWGYVCDIISLRQKQQVTFYTQKAIDFFNKK